MKVSFFVLLAVIGSVIQSYAQSYTLKVSQFDSLIWLAKKGKFCDTLSKTHLNRITALENLTLTQGALIELRGREVAKLKELDSNWSDRLTNQNDLFQIEKSTLKTRIRKRNKIIVAETTVIGVLLLILLL